MTVLQTCEILSVTVTVLPFSFKGKQNTLQKKKHCKLLLKFCYSKNCLCNILSGSVEVSCSKYVPLKEILIVNSFKFSDLDFYGMLQTILDTT